MADNRTMAQMLQAPIEGYEDAIVIPPINANNFEGLFKKKATVNQSCAIAHIYGTVENENWTPSSIVLTMAFASQKVRYSRSRANDSRVSTDAPLSNSSPSNNSFDMQQIAASLEDKMTIKMNKMLNEMKALVVTTPAPVKAVEESTGFSDSLLQQSLLQTLSDCFTQSPTLTPFGESIFFSLMKPMLFIAIYDDQFRRFSCYATLMNQKDGNSEGRLKEFTSHLEYAFLEENNKLPVIISKDLSQEEKTSLINVLKNRKQAIAWKLSDIRGIDPEFCSHKILLEDDYQPSVQHQRRVNPKIHDVIKKEVEKLLDAGLIYPISDSPWVSPVHCVPKKGGMTVVTNEENELVPTRLVTGWRVCIDYRKLNEATCKDHFPLPFMDQMLERLAGNEFYCFLDGFSGYFQIPIDPKDQEKNNSRCPFELSRTDDSRSLMKGIEVDKAKVDVISKLPHPTNSQRIRSFSGTDGFYRRFIKDFPKF
ncbi:hypothetical protein Tco_1163263 [Tanacetum coccineum]